MKCSDIEELLSAYANNELSLTQREFVEGHLANCADCRVKLTEYSLVRQQLSSLRAMPARSDIKELTMLKIKGANTKMKLKYFSWRFAIPTLAILGITFLLCQFWLVPVSNRTVLANALEASETIQSYRVTRTPGVSVIGMGTEVHNTNTTLEEYVLPDKAHIQLVLNGITNEYIFMGNVLYYSTNNNLIIDFPYIPGYPEFTTDAKMNLMSQTVNELQDNYDLQKLPDEFIDGILCFHYQGLGKNNPYTTEIWIGKSDNIIRQVIKQKILQDSEVNGVADIKVTKFYDFNAEIVINAPLTATGEVLPGWKDVKLK